MIFQNYGFGANDLYFKRMQFMKTVPSISVFSELGINMKNQLLNWHSFFVICSCVL